MCHALNLNCSQHARVLKSWSLVCDAIWRTMCKMVIRGRPLQQILVLACFFCAFVTYHAFPIIVYCNPSKMVSQKLFSPEVASSDRYCHSDGKSK